MDLTRVLEQCRISPAPAPASVAQPFSLPLTFFDILWLRSGPVKTLFLYPFPHTTATFKDSYLPNLKSSLSLTLRHFRPLAGRLRLSPDPCHHYELHCAEGDSVPLAVAETDIDFLDLVGSHARESHKFRSLVPPLPELDADVGTNGPPLLAVQATVFPNRGIGIGVTVRHVACDGATFVHFIKSWASSTRSGGRVPLAGDAPSFDRSVIVDPCNLYSEFLQGMSAVPPAPPAAAEEIGAPSDLVRATFTLRPDHIEGLKALVVGRKEPSTFNCSTFVVTCAYMWTCIVKSRGYRADTKAYIGFLVDWRRRLRPPVPDEYFGNCVGFCLEEAKVGDLVQECGVVVAAETIGRAIQGLKEGVSECLAGFYKKYLPVRASGCPILGTAGSPRFKVYDVDFGWGRPLKVEITSVENAGAISLSDSREAQGGVEVGVVLPKHEMEALEAHFEDGLKLC
ncbi:anthocyanin 5-aromatic acyltransferase [Iris pallida]|uniref:Anthocyanin 5-aromatic acyltransferase n=1 Tax=Iris pallida TaxID=29817 RepID=A0AAX6HW65_IRIPA|nr:anthocyanin 5-aromatic acyltransferase [Iris pallida]